MLIYYFMSSVLTLFFLTGLCQSQDSKWYMLVGGLNSLDKVSLYNWETREQCELGVAPFLAFGLTGMSLSGIPLVCGVNELFILTKNLCYKYDKSLKKWSLGPELLSPIDLATSIFVANDGWYIFGGNQDYRSQKLTSIGSKWEYGPELVDRTPVSQQCAVKLSDTTTAFIGGTSNPRGIVTFNWSTMTHQKMDEKFRDVRLESGCAVTTSSTGQQLVAVVGGLNTASMEVWNPRDNSIQTLIDVVPPSIGSTYGLPSPQMFSVKDGKEIFAFFGFPDVKAAYGEVWKYSVDSNNWSKEATLAHGIFRHVAFPVDGITC